MENKEIINQFLSELLDGVRQAGAFVKEQLPLVLQEYIAWGIAEGALGIILGLLGVLFGYLLGKWSWTQLKDGEFNMTGFLGMIGAGLLMVMGGSTVCQGAWQLLKALIAPRVYLIDELSKLL